MMDIFPNPSKEDVCIPSQYEDMCFYKNCKIYYCFIVAYCISHQDMADIKKTIKFHGLEVANVIVRYFQKEVNKPDVIKIQEFDAKKDPQICETVNIQVVSEFVTITFYKNESDNKIIRRELIPTFIVEHIWVSDLQQ
jgi:hypothetical protein